MHALIPRAIPGICLAAVLLSVDAPPVPCSPFPPPVSDEYVLDHGFRYLAQLDLTERCAIARADSILLFAYRDVFENRIVGYRRHVDGREIDHNGLALVPGGVDVGTFDLSPFDGHGWMLAHLSDPVEWGREYRSLWIRSLLLEDPGGSGPAVLVANRESGGFYCPTLGLADSLHVLAWAEGYREMCDLRLVRVTRDLVVVDDEPITVASDCRGTFLALGQDDRGGLILWADSERNLRGQPLDRQGLPVGESVAVGELAHPSQALWSVARHGESNWLVAWMRDSNTIEHALLDQNSQTLPPGVSAVAPACGYEGLMVLSNGSTGLIAWRSEWDGRVLAVRISAEGERLDPEPILVDDFGVYARDYVDDHDRRNLGGVWGRDAFVLSWNIYPPMETARADQKQGLDWESRVSARWIPPADPLAEESVLISQQSLRWPSGVHFAEGRYHVLAEERHRDYYIHTQSVGYMGEDLRAPSRYRSPSSERDGCQCCWTCESDYIRGLRIRAWGADAMLCYGYWYFYSGNYFYEEQTHVIVDRVAPDGSLLMRVRVEVESVYDETAASPESFDVAAGDQALFVAYSARKGYGGIPYIEAKQVDPDGPTIRGWKVESSAAARAPTLVGLGSRAMMIWVEDREPPVLLHAILDPDDPEEGIVGSVLINRFESIGDPVLVPGHGQSLCVFPARSEGGSGHDIHAMRFDAEGVPIDPVAFQVSEMPEDEGNVQGVWDTNQYLVAWGVLDAPSIGIYGARVGSNGTVPDETPFLIAPGDRGPARMASDPTGIVAAVYGGHRLRYIEDTIAVPVLDDPEEEAPDEEAGPATLRIGRIQPNPALGRLRLDLDLPAGADARVVVVDPAGRVVARARIAGPLQGPTAIWDGNDAGGRACPAGVYFVRISTAEEETVRRAVMVR